MGNKKKSTEKAATLPDQAPSVAELEAVTAFALKLVMGGHSVGAGSAMPPRPRSGPRRN